MLGSKKLSRFVQSLDKYGHPICLNIEGEPVKKTVLGGYVTIVLLLALFTYGVYDFLLQINKPFTWNVVKYEERLVLDSN
jgi:hypothetical protein